MPQKAGFGRLFEANGSFASKGFRCLQRRWLGRRYNRLWKFLGVGWTAKNLPRRRSVSRERSLRAFRQVGSIFQAAFSGKAAQPGRNILTATTIVLQFPRFPPIARSGVKVKLGRVKHRTECTKNEIIIAASPFVFGSESSSHESGHAYVEEAASVSHFLSCLGDHNLR